MYGRRSFLRLFGAASVSAPLAAKAAVESEMTSLTSLVGSGAASLASGEASIGPYSNGDEAIKAANFLKVMKPPAFVEDRVREYSRNVYCLDPDIACMRSFSLNYKIMLQRQRNYERELARMSNRGLTERLQRSFLSSFGFRWDI